MPVIPAAGTIPWRHVQGTLEVALVHRPRYDDWSWPKGKLDASEEWPVAAARETLEETGLVVQLGVPLPSSEYTVLDRDGSPATKEVRYWAAEVAGGDGLLVNEIDDVAWLDRAAAYDRLDYARDRDQLLALVRADQLGYLRTRPLAVVRHAKAVPRSTWRREDPQRPLEESGQRRSAALGGVLAAYGISRLVSSPSARCADTLRPYAASLGRALRLREELSEEGFAADPTGVVGLIRRELTRSRATALCSHGPVLPTIIGALLEHVAPDAAQVTDLLDAVAAHGMSKGEVLVAHLTPGPDPLVVAVERHRP
ncbi:MAG: NUDIX domain-containing protein [Nostocoides sp.]